jgi:hypothetical protein
MWKSRNDYLFGRKKGEPYQINIMHRPCIKNMELPDPSDTSLQMKPPTDQERKKQGKQEQGGTIETGKQGQRFLGHIMEKQKLYRIYRCRSYRNRHFSTV